MLPSGTQDCGFAPDRSRRIFRNGKIHGTQSFVEYQNKVHDTEQSKAIIKNAGKIHIMQYNTIQTTIESPIPE
jgi:hypothetical protein